MTDERAFLYHAFGRRYRDWCVAQVEAEVADDFSLVRQLRNYTAMRYVAWADALDVDARRTFALSMLQRRFDQALVPSGIDPALLDLPAADQFSKSVFSTPPPPSVQARLPRPTDRPPKLPRSALWNALREALEPTVGVFGKASGGERSAVRQFGSWTIVTRVDLGGRTRQVDYDHIVHLGPPPRDQRHRDRAYSALDWLGIFPGTPLDFYGPDEIAELASAVRCACERFMNAMPKLTEGLDLAVPSP